MTKQVVYALELELYESKIIGGYKAKSVMEFFKAQLDRVVIHI